MITVIDLEQSDIDILVEHYQAQLKWYDNSVALDWVSDDMRRMFSRKKQVATERLEYLQSFRVEEHAKA